MTRNHRLSAFVLAALVASACLGTETGNPGPRGCGTVCNACGAPIVLEFPDAANRAPAISTIIVDSREVACEAGPGDAVRCELAEEFYGVPARYQLSVEVMGFEAIELSVDVPTSGRSDCVYDGVTVLVELPESPEG
jgi:hypothetical protein